MALKKNTAVHLFAPTIPSIKEKWDIQKALLKKMYPSLNDNDLRYEEGKKGVMWAQLQEKLGLSKDELRKLITSVS